MYTSPACKVPEVTFLEISKDELNKLMEEETRIILTLICKF
jgi:hypothetical protein